jgi:hypothetical protein
MDDWKIRPEFFFVSDPIEVAQPMSAISNPASRLAAPDSRPMVVTVVVVGYLLICSLGGLNALVILANGSTRVVLVESPSQNPFENHEPGSEYSEFFPEPRKPELVDLERIFSIVFVVVAICGVAGGIGLFNRKTWSRGLLWATTGAAIAGHALYAVRVLQIQSVEIIDVLERQQAFQLVATTSLINVAIQSIPLLVLAGLLRHSALRGYVFGSPHEHSPLR